LANYKICEATSTISKQHNTILVTHGGSCLHTSTPRVIGFETFHLVCYPGALIRGGKSSRLEARLGLDSARRSDKPSLNLPIKARGSTSPLDEACKPARRLDGIKKFAMTFVKNVIFHNYKQQLNINTSITLCNKFHRVHSCIHLVQ
jgi:hypothetical protein